MAMKGYPAFPKVPASLEPHHQIVQCHIQDTRWGGVLPLCRGAVGVFYSPSQLDNWIQSCPTRLVAKARELSLLYDFIQSFGGGEEINGHAFLKSISEPKQPLMEFKLVSTIPYFESISIISVLGSIYSCTGSMIFSDWLRSFITITQPVLKIFKMTTPFSTTQTLLCPPALSKVNARVQISPPQSPLCTRLFFVLWLIPDKTSTAKSKILSARVLFERIKKPSQHWIAIFKQVEMLG